MSENRIMVTGEKETFLVRVLVKKMTDAGIESFFCPWTVDAINAKWDGVGLVTVFMGDGDRIGANALQFLHDKMAETGTLMIPIGDKEDMVLIRDRIPADMIYKAFTRPLDNEEYVKTVTDLYKKVESGEFRKSVLIVDDDPSYLNLVRDWLKGTYKVAMANSGLQAIKWLGKNKVDLILLDHEMPVTTGPQVLEMLRSDEETKSIPVIFLTGKSDKESVMAVVALKPEGYFLKTIQKDELLQKLADFFAGKKV